jgi:hypothetical protein
MEAGWTLIFMTAIPYDAEMVKQICTNQDIEAVILNKRDSTYTTFGEIEVYVKEEDREAALNLIKEFKN